METAAMDPEAALESPAVACALCHRERLKSVITKLLTSVILRPDVGRRISRDASDLIAASKALWPYLYAFPLCPPC